MTVFGAPHLHHLRTDSTNERARELAISGAPSGTVVTATEQSAGRGRRGRVWSAPPGSALLLSAVLRPLSQDHLLLPLSVPVAICEAIESLSPHVSRIKWPNDVWIDERKVAGVLIEARPPDFAVIGAGVNVSIAQDEFPADLRWPAISIGGGVSVPAVRGAVCERLTSWAEAPEAEVLAAYRDRDALKGREISWQGAGDAVGDSGAGTADGIDDRGNLIAVRAGCEPLLLGSGEVQLTIG